MAAARRAFIRDVGVRIRALRVQGMDSEGMYRDRLGSQIEYDNLETDFEDICSRHACRPGKVLSSYGQELPVAHSPLCAMPYQHTHE